MGNLIWIVENESKLLPAIQIVSQPTHLWTSMARPHVVLVLE
jgi:hypothetical protein